MVTLAVVMITPLFVAHSLEGYARFRRFELFRFAVVSPVLRRSTPHTHARFPRGQELPPSKLRATRHDSPVLIFDELKHGLLLRAVGGLLRAAGGPAAI